MYGLYPMKLNDIAVVQVARHEMRGKAMAYENEMLQIS